MIRASHTILARALAAVQAARDGFVKEQTELRRQIDVVEVRLREFEADIADIQAAMSSIGEEA